MLLVSLDVKHLSKKLVPDFYRVNCEANGLGQTESIHLVFSTKAPSTIGFARVKPTGSEAFSGKLNCTTESKDALKCNSGSSKKEGKFVIQGSFSAGDALNLEIDTDQYKCKPWTQINLNAVKYAH